MKRREIQSGICWAAWLSRVVEAWSRTLFLLSVGIDIIRKLQNRHPQYGPFKLGGWGLPINLFALVFIVYVVTFLPFPVDLLVTATNMNYAGPLVGAIILMALGDWFTSGRKRFEVPVARTAKADL